MKVEEFENCNYYQVVEKLTSLANQIADAGAVEWFHAPVWVEKWLGEKNQYLDGFSPEDYLGEPEGRVRIARMLARTLCKKFGYSGPVWS